MNRRGVALPVLVATAVVLAVAADVVDRVPYINSVLNLVFGGVFLQFWRTMATRADVKAMREEMSHVLDKYSSRATEVIMEVEERLTKRIETNEQNIAELWKGAKWDRRGKP